MDITAAMMGTGFAKDAATLNLAASIEEDGVFPSMTVPPFEVGAGDQFEPSPVSNAQHAKIVIALVAGVFAIIGTLAWYLMVT